MLLKIIKDFHLEDQIRKLQEQLKQANDWNSNVSEFRQQLFKTKYLIFPKIIIMDTLGCAHTNAHTSDSFK